MKWFLILFFVLRAHQIAGPVWQVETDGGTYQVAVALHQTPPTRGSATVYDVPCYGRGYGACLVYESGAAYEVVR